MNTSLLTLIKVRIQKGVDALSLKFNLLPGFWKRFLLIAVGLAAAAVCLAIIIEALSGYPNETTNGLR
jgi:hypothetical protein